MQLIVCLERKETRNVKMASHQDAWYLSLLGLAENFRTSNPQNIKACIQCLQAVFFFKPPPKVEARTHLQLGNILLTHTKNIDLARSHLEQAVSCHFYLLFIFVIYYYYCYYLIFYYFTLFLYFFCHLFFVQTTFQNS